MLFSTIALTLAGSAFAAPAIITADTLITLASPDATAAVSAVHYAPTDDLLISSTTSSSLASLTTTLPLPEGPIKWMGQVEEDGPMINITGYHHEVRMRIRDLNPYWQREGYVWNDTTTDEEASEFSFGLEKRSQMRDPRAYCNDRNKPYAKAGPTRTNVEYLRTHYGNAYCGVAPRQCGRFSCSYNSAVLLCNDNPTELVIPCPTFYQNAKYIIGNCNLQSNPFNGQCFYVNPSYNVILAGTNPGRSC